MRHYHGTPMGGKRDEVSRFFVRRFALVPFLRQEDLPIVAESATGFAFDNSAFTAWKSGKPITDWKSYYEWCREWTTHPGFDFAIIPDVIDGTERDNDLLLKDWQKKMYYPRLVFGVPVWHMHESLERLHRLCTGVWRCVAIGSSGEWPTPGTEKWWSRMRDAMHVATDKDGKPHCKLHGLRMLDPKIFTRLPLSSADSTNVARNASLVSRFGTYKPPTRSQCAEVIASRIEAHSSACRWIPNAERQLSLWSA